MGEALITRRGGGGGDVIEMIAQGGVRYTNGGAVNAQIESGGYYRGCVYCTRSTVSEKKGCISWRDPYGGEYTAIVDWENSAVTQIVDSPKYESDDYGMNYGYEFSGSKAYLAVKEDEWGESDDISVEYFYEV